MRRLGGIACVLVAACLAGCGDSSSTNADGGTDGGGDVTVDAGPDAPPGCELTKDPKDSAACVDDAVGIFVDGTNGDDGNAGTKLEPVKTIGAALKLTSAQQARVYVCEGTYAEDVVVDASHDGVSIYGGWRCADWSYSGTKPIVGAGTMALKLDGLTKAVTIEDMDWKSADATADGGSSIAAFVNGCANVTLVRDTLEAGKGKAGAAGTLTNFNYPDQATLNGKDASGMTGGPANAVKCPAGDTTTGGKGGDNGSTGDPGLPSLGAGQGGTLAACGSGGSGSDGAPASKGPDGSAPSGLGSLSSQGWASMAGGAAKAGGPGQGGGGGLGFGGGGGGGGGAGGCGGAGGPGGGGGGASVALVVLSSTVTVTASALQAATAGAGGTGAAGQPGETTFGFHGNGTGAGCQGGNGGTGGNGGAGGGGAGGISVGVLWKGTAAPTLDSSTNTNIVFAQQGGAKGTGGAPGTNDGIDGVAQAVLEVK